MYTKKRSVDYDFDLAVPDDCVWCAIVLVVVFLLRIVLLSYEMMGGV